MRYRLIVFVFLLILGSALGSWISLQEKVLGPLCEFQAAASAVVMHGFGSSVIQSGNQLRDPDSQKAIAILWACSGADATFILFAAIAVYPSCWRAKLKGLMGGFMAVQVMNVLRIISLYYLNSQSEALFRFAHLYLWQGLLMLDVLVFMLLWLRWERGQCPNP